MPERNSRGFLSGMLLGMLVSLLTGLVIVYLLIVLEFISVSLLDTPAVQVLSDLAPLSFACCVSCSALRFVVV